LRRALPPLLALVVGALSLALTAGLWVHERRSEQARLKAIFDFNLRQAATRIEERVANYEQMLRGAQGLFLSSDSVERDEFERYVDAVMSGPDAAGLQGFAHSELVRARELPAYVAAQRKAGVVGYHVHPPGARELYAPLKFIAPERRRNQDVLGLDPLADPVRRVALLQARDSGNLAITQRVTLTSDAGADGAAPGRSSILMYLPLYEKGQALDTIEQRRAHATGWVSAAFRVDDLMSTLYGEESPGLAVRLYDGTGVSDALLMYSSLATPAASAASRPPIPAPRFEAQEYIAFSGHAWTLQLSSLPEFERRLGQDAAGVILVAGVGLSLLLGLLTHQLVSGRTRAYGVAQAMTRELRESEARYRRIVETASEGIWIVDVGGRIAFANPRIAQWLGTTDVAMLGRPLDAFMDPTEAARCRAALARWPIEGGETVELRLRRADGSEMWVALSSRTIVDNTGHGAGALGMLTDIDERRHAEARRAALEAQLRDAQKMEAIGTLAGGIAHDFNNILAAIIGNAAMAREDRATGRDGDQSLAQIERAAVRARSLVQQILTFSRMQAQTLEVQPLQPVIEETLDMLRAAMPAQVELRVQLAPEPVFVRADATQIQQVVMNLCTNAWHALPAGRGRIEVGLEILPQGAHDAEELAGTAAALPAGPLAHLWISDTGSGMDEATRARVFEPFFTTKQVGHGTGLGLAVVHGIVRAHGGAIRVESAPGVGTRFDLHFPLQAAPGRAVAAPPEQPAGAPRGHGEHVLCIDDDPTMALMTEGLLVRSGYRVSAFEDPLAALAAARANPGAFDIVVTDYNMPDMNGMEFAETLRRFAPELPVIVTSGFISEEMRAQAEERRLGALLQKEYTFERLAGLVHGVLAQRRAKA
jgi:PAS domain S-box-containing protein